VVVALIRQYVEITDVLRERSGSIRRLQRVDFGPHSERRHHDRGARAEHDAGTTARVKT